MSTNRIRATVSIGMACGLAVVLFFVLLGHHPLAEWDEGIYAEVAREMLPNGAWSGSWLTPHWNYQLWMEKPPLLMWLTALLYRMIGVSEFSARVISASAGVLTVGLLHAWLLKRFDALSAWLATLILLATFGFQHASRVGETDVLLSLCSFLALIGLTRGRSSEPRGFLLFWIGFALAFMTKGMASLVLLLTATGMLVWDHFRGRRLSRNARLELSLGSLVFLAICVPWQCLDVVSLSRRVHKHLLRVAGTGSGTTPNRRALHSSLVLRLGSVCFSAVRFAGLCARTGRSLAR